MPKYSFKCKSCDKTFRIIAKPTDLKSVVCKYCESKDINRLYNFVGQVVERDMFETIESVKEDAKKIAKKVKSGDQNSISEIYGKEK